MNELELLKLVASCESALDAAQRSLTIARALAGGYRSGVHPPDVVLEAYFASFERDEAQFAQVREKLLQAKSELELQAAER